MPVAGHLTVPEHRRTGVVVFAHGSGSSRHSPRNRYVAGVLERGRPGHAAVRPADRPRRSTIGPTSSTSSCSPAASATSPMAAEPTRDGRAARSATSGPAPAPLRPCARPRPPTPTSPPSCPAAAAPTWPGPALGAVRAPTLLIVGGHDDVRARAQPPGPSHGCAARPAGRRPRRHAPVRGAGHAAGRRRAGGRLVPRPPHRATIDVKHAGRPRAPGATIRSAPAVGAVRRAGDGGHQVEDDSEAGVAVRTSCSAGRRSTTRSHRACRDELVAALDAADHDRRVRVVLACGRRSSVLRRLRPRLVHGPGSQRRILRPGLGLGRRRADEWHVRPRLRQAARDLQADSRSPSRDVHRRRHRHDPQRGPDRGRRVGGLRLPAGAVLGVPEAPWVWVARLGLERAKRYLFTGDEIPA